MSDDARRIVIEAATINQVRTLADGGIRLTLDLPETDVYAAAWMMQVKADSGVIRVTAELTD